MIITGAVHVDRVTAHFPYLRSEGYTPLLAYPGNSKELTSRKNFSWETLLKGVCPLSVSLSLLKRSCCSELVFFCSTQTFRGDGPL